MRGNRTKRSAETLLKMSLSHRGQTSGFKGKKHTEESKAKIRESSVSYGFKGKTHSLESRNKISKNNGMRNFVWKDDDSRIDFCNSVKSAMHRPEVREKHIEGLLHSKWIKVRTDKGQLEMIERWNQLGFNFEPNYQFHTDTDLFYVDGYDKEHNVIFEYDSAYHKQPHQMKKDLKRQNTLIAVLNPTAFWRYDVTTKTFSNVIERMK